ncbi:MAG: LCP family protein [Parcubacteria group bacterium]|jgi:LCP family protein required for cell wall assembly
MDAIYYRSPKKNTGKKVFFILLAVVFLAALSYGGFFMYKIYSVSKKISVDNATSQPSFLETVKSLTTDNSIDLGSADPNRINILLLGMAGKGKPGQYLTDTIMIMSIDRKTNRVAMLSIPRDLYVTIPNTGYQNKINTVYQLGMNSAKNSGTNTIDPLLAVIKSITALDIDYWAVLNFDGFRKAIDDIGGINIVNEKDLYDARYPGPNYSYEIFELKKGFHHLDGATALKYARERHNDPQSDFGRAKRQQEIMQAVKNKIFSATTIFNPIALNNLLDTLGNNASTNITPDEIGSFLELSKKLDTQNITNAVLDAWNKDSLLKIIHTGNPDAQFSALIPRVGNYSEVQDLAQNIFDLDKIKRTRDEIAKESARIAIVNQSGDFSLSEKIRKLLNVNLAYKNVITINSSNKSPVDVSMVYDSTSGTKPFTANELVTKLPAVISYSDYSLPSYSGSKFDIVVVLGKDLVAKYNMEEGTLEDLNKARDDQESADFNKN